jgi:hypothetical protein
MSRRHSDFRQIRRAMGINEHDSDRSAAGELGRMRRRGLIEWRPGRLEWVMLRAHARGLCDIVTGHAFQTGDRAGRQ